MAHAQPRPRRQPARRGSQARLLPARRSPSWRESLAPLWESFAVSGRAVKGAETAQLELHITRSKPVVAAGGYANTTTRDSVGSVWAATPSSRRKSHARRDWER